MRNIFFTIAFLGMIACNQENSNMIRHYNFENQITIKHEKIYVEPIANFIKNLILTDSLLIAIENTRMRYPDHFFRTYKIPSLDFYGNFIKRGRGPKEETGIYEVYNSPDKEIIYYKTLTSIKSVQFDLKKNILKKLNKVSIPSEFGIFQLKMVIDNNTFYGTLNTKEIQKNQEFSKFNSVTGKIELFGPPHPYSRYNSKAIDLLNMHYCNLTVKPDKTKFASLYTSFPRLRIYDRNGKIEKELLLKNKQVFPLFYVDPKNRENYNASTINYIVVKSTNNYIYGLYIGCTRNENNKKGNIDFLATNIIHIWDWEGNPIKEVLLDKEVNCFDVAKDDSFIIASNPEFNNYFYKYKLINIYE